MTATTADKTLLVAPKGKQAPKSPTLVRVAREAGVGPFRQFGQILALNAKGARLNPSEYYDFQLYDKSMSAEKKAEFIGVKRSADLSAKMSPDTLPIMGKFLSNKVVLTNTLRGSGLPTTKTQAVAHKTRSFGNIPALRTAEDVIRFFTEEAVYPVFGKPLWGSLSEGSACFQRLSDDGKTLMLSNGKSIGLEEMAREISSDYGKQGFLLQDAVDQHSAMTELAGPALGSIRTVTVVGEEGRARVLYALWKIPSPKAMSDNFWQDGSMLAQLDLDTGEVVSVRRGTSLDTTYLDKHPVSGKSFEGFKLPHFELLKETAEQAHMLFPYIGCLGWDIGMSEDGPVLVECNTKPFHTLYQLATGEGVMNPRFAKVFQQVMDHQNARVKQGKADAKAAKKAARKQRA
mgnify:CR=1 FL=1